MIKPFSAKLSSVFKFKPLALSAAMLPVLSGLAGCGGAGQDVGATTFNAASQQEIKGTALDGYLARAMVFIDYDNNATRDPWEPFAFTDDQGYYTYNPLTDTDYCRVDASSEESVFCLRSDRPVTNNVIRVDGGYDVLTGEPFVGQLSRRVSLDPALVETPSIMISPLTTLFTNLESAVDREVLLSNLGISEEELDVDYLNTDGVGGVNYKLLNTAVKIHKVISLLADQVEDTYFDIGEQVGTPNDLSSAVYRELASYLSLNINDVHSALANSEVLTQLVASAESKAREVYTNRDFILPADNVASDRVSQSAANLIQVIDQLLPQTGQSTSLEELVGRSRAVESVVIKALNENGGIDASIEAAVNFFTDENNAELIASLVTNLGQSNGDLNTLVSSDYSFASQEEVDQDSSLPEDVAPFSYVAGKQLRVSDWDLGYAPSNLRDIEVEAYFKGDSWATSGSFDACVKYIEGASSDGSLGEANSKGELVHGYWSLLGAEDNNGESYSLVLTIDFIGATYQTIMKPGVIEEVEGEMRQQIRFDYAGEIRRWHSDEGLVDRISSLPTSHLDCQQRLPSRVGI